MHIENTGTNAVSKSGIEDGKYYVKTSFNDKLSLERNKQIKLSGALDKAQLGLHDTADIRMVLSIPSTLQWSLFQKKHPDLIKLIHSKTESERIEGCRKIAILEPDWVIQSRL